MTTQITSDRTIDSTLTAKGQTTVPLAIRTALNAHSGAKLRWSWHPDGSINVRLKTGSYKDLVGMLTPAKGKRLSVDALSV